MALRTKEQRRAEHAFGRVQDAAVKLPDTKAAKKYGSMAHKLPVLIRTAGLSQALAFVNSRGSDEQHRLLDDIAATLASVNVTYKGFDDRHKLASQSRQSDLLAYMHLTREVLAACLWYKRFAESVLNVDASQESDEAISEAAA